MKRPLLDFALTVGHDARPVAAMGVQVTPGNNTMGSWATLTDAPLSGDHHGIEIWINSIAVNGAATDSLTDIGIDPAGGTSFTPIIPYLLSSYSKAFGAANVDEDLGSRWYFPLRLPSGCSIGARGSINNATVGVQDVHIHLYKASHPQWDRFGSAVVSFGEVTGASCGTDVTYGTASNGSFTQLGSSIVSPPPWFWQFSGAPKNSNALTANSQSIDLAIGSSTGTNKLVGRHYDSTNANEGRASMALGFFGRSAVGDNVYVRGWNGGAGTSFTAIAHGVIG